MLLSFEQIKEITFGAIRIENTDGQMRFYKYSDEVISAFGARKDTFGARAATTTGVRFDFHTNSKRLKIEVEEPKKFEIYVDGLLRYTMRDTASLSVNIDTPRGKTLDEARITVYFPSHSVGKFKSLELDDGAYVRPHKFDKKILFMGDSITQGFEAKFDSLSYANKVSRYFNADSIIQGVGGACFFPETLEFVPIDFDFVVVAYGTNDFNRYGSVADFKTPLSEYMSKLSGLYGDKKIFVISPLWRKLNTPEVYAELERYREEIESEAQKYGFINVDGCSLVPPVESLYTDGLHPNDTGFSLYAENLIKVIESNL